MAYKTKFSGSTDINITVSKDTPIGTLIEGYFLGSKETPDTMGYGPGRLHVFKTPEGDVGVWGKSRLNATLTADLVGQMVLVKFTGMIPSTKKGKSASYGFEVQHDPSNLVEVSADALDAPQDADDYSDDADDTTMVDAPLTRPVARPTLKAPDAAQRAKVNALLAGRKTG